MVTQPEPYLTPEQYLEGERVSEIKHEYFQGKIYALAGASSNRNLIAGNVYFALRTQLRNRRCHVYFSDIRIKIPRTGLYTYPDISALCGTPLFDDNHKDNLLNPTIIIEVLSPSTEHYDRGKKFQHYRTIDSLCEYVLIEQDSYHIERYLRQGNAQWTLSEADGLETVVELSSIACRLPLAEVYEEIDIEG